MSEEILTVMIHNSCRPDRSYKPKQTYQVERGLIGYRVINSQMIIYSGDCVVIDSTKGERDRAALRGVMQ